MKKIMVCLLTFLILTVGCKKVSNNELKCTLTKQQDENSIIQTIETKFENNKAISINIKMQTLLNEKYVPYIDSFVKQIEEQFNNYKDKKGITSDIYQDESSVTVSILFNINNLDDTTKSELGFIDVNDSYDDTKLTLEKKGYICK